MGDETRIGVDIGGTFTDVVTVSGGTVAVHKTPSTPDAPEEGVIDGLEAAREDGAVDPEGVSFLAHGTTVATNAVLERDWAETALVTTAGFRDALEIGRQARPDLYDFGVEKPRPIAERDRRYEVPERLDERGNVVEPLDEEAVRALAAEIDAESVAVSLLFSFENDDHERRVRDLLAEELDASFSLSSRVLPEMGEYERTLATTLNAALRPVIDDYLGRLRTRVEGFGVPAELAIMGSSGGIISTDAARERPIVTLLSGPAAGVLGAAHVAGLAGVDDVVTMDMGGTSCDVSLVRGGDPARSTEVSVGDYPVSVPMIDVHTIGAGGGSIAWLDAGGALRVGPRSAGADPGPVCYGRGGTEPTVTDAHLLLGRLDPAGFLSGLDADVDAAERAMAEHVADPLGTSVEEAAAGVLDVANANMERALRVVSVERGHDPRSLGLVAFGGAGPLHAPELARELEIPRVLVPRAAGVLSALGLLASDVVYDFSTTRVRDLAAVDPGDLKDRFEAFEARGRDRLADRDDVRFERRVDLRYRGQSFDLGVDVPGGDLDAGTVDDLAEAFNARHRERYGHASPDEPLELAAIRLRARGVVEPPDLERVGEDGTVDDAVREERPVVLDGEVRDTRVYDRARLPAGGTFAGPAVVEGTDATVVVLPGQDVTVDDAGTLVVAVAP